MKKFLSQRMLSLDHSTFNDDEEEDGDNTYGPSGGGHSMMTQHEPENHQQILPQLPPAPQQQALAQAPSKPLAPFALFFRDTVTAIKQQNPACSLEQISVIVQTMWDSLDETQKNVYSQRHEQDKRDYVRHMRDYRQQLSETEINPPEANNSIPDASVPAIQTTDLITPNIDSSAEQTPALAAATATSTEAPPEQIQLLTEAAQAPKCTREQCNKPAIINPDWEDEYCSNECVVIHCRNVFNDWALSLKNSPT
ncbi:LOW QUALITY PROTEIN: TOX high mobility group box family member 4 [Drosophila obscura]|uniref:LOW QUALITY PROTEIN: TOX high mobility group box family member 4 n=1 Tax=Drosophila obscura TaxID=7282 RepID=UPI001BB1CDA5|nr:LOW QUALITY PROTEIN: TOX high mobility group box family member 4 [Drosophila obscura]